MRRDEILKVYPAWGQEPTSNRRLDYRSQRFREPLLAPPPPPPKNSITPRTKPKLYHAPLLCTSYTFTVSEKSDQMKVNKTMKPCSNPCQKPATLPAASGVPTN